MPGFSECGCTKPSPEFIFEAVRDYGIDVSRLGMVGGGPTDIECEYRAGLRAIRIEPDHPSADAHNDWPKADYYATDPFAASRIILNGE